MDFGLLITQKSLTQINSLKGLKESLRQLKKASDPNKDIYGYGTRFNSKSILYRFMEWAYYYGLDSDRIFTHYNFENALRIISELHSDEDNIISSMIDLILKIIIKINIIILVYMIYILFYFIIIFFLIFNLIYF